MHARSIKSKLALALGAVVLLTWGTTAVFYAGAVRFEDDAHETRQANDNVRELLAFALVAHRYVNAVSQSLGQRTLIANHERRSAAAGFEQRIARIGTQDAPSVWRSLDWPELRRISSDLNTELRAADALRAHGDFFHAEQVFSQARKQHFDQRMLPWFERAIDRLKVNAGTLEASEIVSVSRLQKVGAVFGALTALLALLAVLWISRAIIRPVTALKAGAEAIGRGELGYRVSHDATDEFALLAEGFNRMAETIATAQSTLQHRNAQLERAYELQSEFISIVSHELRSPLHSILGYVEFVIEDEPNLAGPSRTNLANIVAGARRLLALINDILDFSKLEAHQMHARVTRFPLTGLLEAAFADARAFARGRPVELRLQTPSEPLLLESDESKLRQIITNLLSNAVKFTDAGSVVLEAHASDEGVELRVVDTGVGIAKEHLALIFEPFRQVGHGGTHASGGTGLGLAIAARLARLIGARVSVHSEVGNGTTFTVVVPHRPAAKDTTWQTSSSSTTIQSSAT